MLSFQQLEKFYKILELIEECEKTAALAVDGMKTSKFDGLPHGAAFDPHQMEAVILRREKTRKQLPGLLAFRDQYLPKVRETIEAATATGKPAVRIKRKLLLQMRYERGLTWMEIKEFLKIYDPKKTVVEILGGMK